MLVIASPVHGASLVTRMLSRICEHVCNPSQIVCGWYDLQVKGVVLFGGDSNRNHHSAWFFIPVFELGQLFGKFFVCLRLGFIALLPECLFLHALLLHILHLLMGRNQSPSEFCVWIQVFHSVGDVGGIAQQQSYNLRCINCMQTWCLHILHW